MSLYIVCQKKRNNPRMDTRICQKKCQLKNECKEYLSIQGSVPPHIGVSLPTDHQPMVLEAA